MKWDGWTREQLIEAIKLYCVTPFGRLHKGNPDIVTLAARLGRTPSALAYKLTNFAALDTSIPQKGMSNYSKLDAAVWQDFFRDPAEFLAAAEAPIRHLHDEAAEYHMQPEGRDVAVQSFARRGQDFFRAMVLASYGNRCALSGIDAPDLLVASHILPWADTPAERTNPRNGLLLNRLHDRAFENGHLVIENDLRVTFSPRLSPVTREKLERTARTHLRLPDRFAPDPAFLQQHREIWMARWGSPQPQPFRAS